MSSVVEQTSYFAERRARVAGFVAQHLQGRGSFRLHGAALGADVVRAPINIVLSPVLLLVRAAALLLDRFGASQVAQWLRARPILLRTSVSARVEAALLRDLLEVPLGDDATPARHEMTKALCSAHPLGDLIRQHGEDAPLVAQRVMRAVGEYTGTRSAVAEGTTALLTLAIGGLLFHALTPGMISMAPDVAEAVSTETAVSAFPLGAALGGVWYGLFPAAPPVWMIVTTGLALVCLGAVVASFAGLLADPLQAAFGLHRRRLMRLLDTVESIVVSTKERPFVAREHLFVRVFDLWDAALSALRLFKG
ncbi:hypothetical protein C8J27_102258 [Rhodobacter aestuarii]|uniref:Uncharacterized protein n=1 Tax=Rhodobacter aestuarii TaxID=453582 RepID=A0A1N7NH14_9RHOB|nr:DUF6635 family protein [Rhodobacter aestuarii]PTV96464.1 hypothetical protein C8J27_102258 [Rhodobacter aestuarii]SIS97602.1 hypothetical protein SAMN05421580_107258 [Rhodobacter aestuarii]